MNSRNEVQRELAALLGSEAEARTLIAHVCGVEVKELLSVAELDDGEVKQLREFAARRAAGVPLQYLTGVAHFRSISVEVGEGVFIPRPETEFMAGWLIDRLLKMPGSPNVVELCAGTGAISKAIAYERPGCSQYAVEIEATAFGYLKQNLDGLGVKLEQGDMATAFPQLNGQADALIANPPYVPSGRELPTDVADYEPAIAVFAGEEGLDAIKSVIETAKRLLRPGGLLAFEHDDTQGISAPDLIKQSDGFSQIRDHTDLNGRPRFVTAMRVWSGMRRQIYT
ncbi:MAG: peptide chain release factor N(5)-glutamine methyltransferase [Propionibacteriaceae bacterium]|nr:peptide chain release factor N(5)-glutamine methyltransferase [Propionibacteriaceae bacterium]